MLESLIYLKAEDIKDYPGEKKFKEDLETLEKYDFNYSKNIVIYLHNVAETIKDAEKKNWKGLKKK